MLPDLTMPTSQAFTDAFARNSIQQSPHFVGWTGQSMPSVASENAQPTASSIEKWPRMPTEASRVGPYQSYHGHPFPQRVPTPRNPPTSTLEIIDLCATDESDDEAMMAMGIIPHKVKNIMPRESSSELSEPEEDLFVPSDEEEEATEAPREMAGRTQSLDTQQEDHQPSVSLRGGGDAAPASRDALTAHETGAEGNVRPNTNSSSAKPKRSLKRGRAYLKTKIGAGVRSAIKSKRPRSPKETAKSDDEEETKEKVPKKKVKLPAIYTMAPAKKKWKKTVKDSESARTRVAVKTNATVPPRKEKNEGPPLGVQQTYGSTTRPEWYAELETPRKGDSTRSQSIALRGFNTLVDKYTANDTNRSRKQKQTQEEDIRSFLFQMSLSDYQGKEKQVIKGSMLLIDNTFLSLEMNSPKDIVNISKWLRERWWKGDTDPNLMRGIKRIMTNKADKSVHASYTFDADQKQHRVSCTHKGEGPLHNGQWWPLQICANRDGAHGEMEAGIAGTKNMGALSIVVSSGGYEDIDEGDTLQYCGTTASELNPRVSSASTELMRTSLAEGSPVRVLRSAKATKSKYRPKRGLRYDGCYQITKEAIIEPATLLYRFTLERIAGQQPICWDGPTKRPHEQELAALQRDTKLRKFVV